MMTETSPSPSKRTEKATLTRALNREKRRNAVLCRSRGRALQQAASAQASPKLVSFFEEIKEMHSDKLKQQKISGEIISNIMPNFSVSGSRRRYTLSVFCNGASDNILCGLQLCTSLPCSAKLQLVVEVFQG